MALSSKKKPVKKDEKPKLDQEKTPEAAQPSELSRVIEESKANLESEEPKPLKRGRGRPPKSEQSAPPTAIEPQPKRAGPFAPILSHAFKLGFDVWAEQAKCEAVKLDQESAEILGNDWDAVAAHYFPQLSGEQSVLVTALMNTGAVVVSKALIVYQSKKEKEEAEKKLKLGNASLKAAQSALSTQAPIQAVQDSTKFDPHYREAAESAPISVSDYIPQGRA